MTFEQIINNVKSGKTFIPCKYNGVYVIMTYSNPDKQYFDSNFTRFSNTDKCWIINVENREKKNTITAYCTTEELNQKDFDRWTKNVK